MYNPVTGKIILSRNVRWLDWVPYDPISSLPIIDPDRVGLMPTIQQPHPSQGDDSNNHEAMDSGSRGEERRQSQRLKQHSKPNRPRNKEDKPTEDEEEITVDTPTTTSESEETTAEVTQEIEIETEEENSENSDEEDTEQGGHKLTRELRSLGITPREEMSRELRNLHTEYNVMYPEINLSEKYPDINPSEILISEMIKETSEKVRLEEIHEINTAVISDPGEPKTMKEAMNGPEAEKWTQAVKNEINNFLSRGVWKRVRRDQVLGVVRKTLMTTKWVFKKKVEQDGSIRYKARCVSKGFMQIPGVDYTESFAPVATDTAIRMVVGIFLYSLTHNKSEDWILEMFDVEAAFLNADLEHQQFIDWPQGMLDLGFITKEEKETYCIELQKAMYGNIDSPLLWMKTFSKFLIEELGLIQMKSDPCIFTKKEGNKLVLLLALYVDDTLCTGPRKWVEWAYEQIETKYKIEKLGPLKKHLGIWWEWKKDEKDNTYLIATMPKMIDEIEAKYKETMDKPAKPAGTPGFPGKHLPKNTGEIIKIDEYRSIVGKLMYYMTKIAPEICNAVRELSSHMTNPGEEAWKFLERCVGYISGRKYEGLTFRAPRELTSISDCDSNYAKDENDRKNISGRINTIGGMISNWSSKKQATVSLSSTEAEYQALSECAQEAMFTQALLKEITGLQNTAIIYEDNLGAIYLVKNYQVSARTKHIDIRHHYVRDLRNEKKLDIRFKRSEDNSADIMTKNTQKELFEKHTKDIRTGSLTCWKEDVKSDPSVTLYGEAGKP
jgi:hypothetical protein